MIKNKKGVKVISIRLSFKKTNFLYMRIKELEILIERRHEWMQIVIIIANKEIVHFWVVWREKKGRVIKTLDCFCLSYTSTKYDKTRKKITKTISKTVCMLSILIKTIFLSAAYCFILFFFSNSNLCLSILFRFFFCLIYSFLFQ